MDAPPSPAATGKRRRSAEDIGPASVGADDVSDAEVEEFYAIIRRVHEQRDAMRGLVSGTGAGTRAPPARAPPWRPSFSLEDFAPPAPAPPSEQQQLNVDEQVAANTTLRRRPVPGIDLNAEPEPEVAPAAPPRVQRRGAGRS